MLFSFYYIIFYKENIDFFSYIIYVKIRLKVGDVMSSILGKLQCEVDRLYKRNTCLHNRAENLVLENKVLKRRIKKKEQEFKEKVEKEVKKMAEKIVLELEKKYEKELNEKNQRILELEAKLNINSTNSNLPSSKTPIYQSKICNSRKKTGENPGRKKNHKKDSLKKFDDAEVTEVKEHIIEKCPNCKSRDLTLTDVKVRDEFDISIKIRKIRHKFYIYKCNDCKKIVKSNIPLELHAENQYGSGIKTLALTLSNYGFVSYNRMRKIICGLTNGEVNPCEGYFAKLQKKASDKLSDFAFDVKEKIISSKLNYWDDTTIKIGDKDHACLRVYSNSKFVLYKAHLKKDTLGLDEDGILQKLSSDCTVMHDHLLHNYCNEYKYKNVECNAHITRKLEGITQNVKHEWSGKMKSLIEETLEKRKNNIKNKINSFTDDEINKFSKNYDDILNDGFKEYIEFRHKYEFTKEENLLEFLRDFKEPITKWVKDFSLPFSNNLSESLLRMSKTKMKVSYQFKSLNYAEYFANIMTYTETCGKFGINKVEAIKRLFDNNPYTVLELCNLKTTKTS